MSEYGYVEQPILGWRLAFHEHRDRYCDVEEA